MIENAAANTKYMFGQTLEPGQYLEIYGTYVSGSNTFTVNIRDANNNYLMHISFRTTYATVFNRFEQIRAIFMPI